MTKRKVQQAHPEPTVEELEQRLGDADESREWAVAAKDPEFRRETDALEGAYRSADAETWPPPLDGAA